MDAYLRPDLNQILPRPFVREIAERALTFAPVRPVADIQRPESFLVDVDRRKAPAADEPGFELHTAQAAAQRVRHALGSDPAARAVHRLARERIGELLGD